MIVKKEFTKLDELIDHVATINLFDYVLNDLKLLRDLDNLLTIEEIDQVDEVYETLYNIGKTHSIKCIDLRNEILADLQEGDIKNET